MAGFFLFSLIKNNVRNKLSARNQTFQSDVCANCKSLNIRKIYKENGERQLEQNRKEEK